jgi:hypothetical protein
VRTPGVILCTADADCPMLAPNCCRPGATNDGNAEFVPRRLVRPAENTHFEPLRESCTQ